MKKNYFLLSFSLLLLAAATYWYTLPGEPVKQPETAALAFEAATGQMRNIETKNLSPYALFGDSSVVLRTQHEETGQQFLEIEGEDEKIIFHMRTGRMKILDKTGKVKEEIQLELNQITRFLTIDPMAEKYYSHSPYNYALNDPVLFVDPDGQDIDLRRFTGKEEMQALKTFLSTKEGYAFFQQFAAKGGQSFTIAGQKFTFKEGARSKDLLVLNSARTVDMAAAAADGMNRTFERKEGNNYSKRLVDADKNSNISQGVTHLIDIDEGFSEANIANTLAHEAFVHTNENVKQLNAIDRQVMKGTLRPGSQEYINALRKVETGNEEHQRLGNGQMTDYRNAAAQMDKFKNSNVQTNLYKKDVKDHQKQ